MSDTVELLHGTGNLDSEDAFSSMDACPELIEYFLGELGLGNSAEFVSLSVQIGDNENPLVRCYGTPYRLKPEHLQNVSIVCAGDFLNVMSKAVLACLKNQKPLCEWRHYFIELPESLTNAERLKRLREAGERSDKIGTYAEARIYGHWEEDWFQEINPGGDNGDLMDIGLD